ncbi:MAG: FmdB family zinc ribbon protein [Anaerolineaceae bacterium]
MPIYTYHCDKCGIRFDQYQKFTDEPLTICPECNEPALRKIYQPVGIVFKGKGFYSTDNRSPSGQTSGHGRYDSSETDKPEETGTKPAENAPKAEPAAAASTTTKTAE